MTTEAEPSAMMGTKQARTGRDSSGTIHGRACWRLVIWRLPDLTAKFHVGRSYKCPELRAGVLMSFLVASTSQAEQVPDRRRSMINESVLHWRSNWFQASVMGALCTITIR